MGEIQEIDIHTITTHLIFHNLMSNTYLMQSYIIQYSNFHDLLLLNISHLEMCSHQFAVPMRNIYFITSRKSLMPFSDFILFDSIKIKLKLIGYTYI